MTSNVVAPDQAVHGASIDVQYKVANSGSNTTRGISAATNSWTDTIWLARDKLRPGAYKGDVLLGSVTHSGNLAVGEDYLGNAQVTIPDNMLSGNYFITVWSDAYDVILEDTLASNINPDDATQIDNNNYKARPISILGITPPDLAVSSVSGVSAADAGGSYTYSYSVKNLGDVFTGAWTDSVFITDNPDLDLAKEVWFIGSTTQQRTLGNSESYSVTQTVQLAPSVTGRYVVVKTDAKSYSYLSSSKGDIAELDESNNSKAASSVVTARPADLQVTAIQTQPENFSGEETTITWTVTNQGAAVWAGTSGWVDSVYISRDPAFISARATALGATVHSNVNGLAAGASYTASTKVKLPPGTDGPYYIYVVTDSAHDNDTLTDTPSSRAASEMFHSTTNPNTVDSFDNDIARTKLYATSVYEGARNNNNITRGSLNITYREPDLRIDAVTTSNPNPSSGETITVTWTVSNTGTRDTRTSSWADGVYLSRDDSLDNTDFPLTPVGGRYPVVVTSLYDAQGKPRFLKPGESYTNSATFKLPESIGGDFHIIVKTDTSLGFSGNPYVQSTIREGLSTLEELGTGAGSVLEFKDEGNNIATLALPITMVSPPDLQVSQVLAPNTVLAGQLLDVSYSVVNAGGNTPSDQTTWNDLVYLSKDRFLDVNQDVYVGYTSHSGGLAAGASYDKTLSITAPRNLDGPYYVFVITDPANVWGNGTKGKVLEFGKEQNNSTAAVQPLLIETPPPADLKVSNIVLPSSANVGDSVHIAYAVVNDSVNTAYGRWTDSVYLSSDNNWDLGDILLGKVDHNGDLLSQEMYQGELTANLPPLKDGTWRIIVRPDLYNEVFEGQITYTDTGLNLPPGEANNRIASGSALQVTVPVLAVNSPLQTTLTNGQTRLYKVSVASGQTLRISLDSSVDAGSNEVYVRYGDIPTSFAFDAAFTNPNAADQEALVPTTQAGDYYVLVRSRQGSETPVTLRADLMPLSITKVTPDQGGTGDDDHRWVTFDIYGASFKAGALVKLARPGINEIEPDRWQVLDATHIRAVFDLRNAPHGLYDVMVSNPDGQTVVEANRYLIERAIEADVTIGIGGERLINPGDNSLYTVSLQSLTNVDTPYVRFDFGATEMGYNADLLEGLTLPYVLFGANVGGSPDGKITDMAGNTQTYGATPTSVTRTDVPWAQLDGAQDTTGFNLAPGYAFDIAGGGFVGMNFDVQTYPGLSEWLNYDFEGLRDKLYATHPDWKAQGLLDGGVMDLNKISSGLAAKFLSKEPDVHITKKEALAMSFSFNVVGAATALTRDEFIAEQTAHAKQLRVAILADSTASASLAVLAADEAKWVSGWLGALETAGLLRPVDQAPPIRNNPEVLSLNATLATGILLSKGGDSYQTQSDLLGFFAKVQAWYGDTATYAGDPNALKVATDYTVFRPDGEGGGVEVPFPVMANFADYNKHAAAQTQFINFNVYAGDRAQLEYLQHIGVLDEYFQPLSPQALNLTQFLQQAAQQSADAQALISVTAPQGVLSADSGPYVPADTPLPYTFTFNNPSSQAVGQVRIVTELDADLDIRTLRLGDLKLGDMNVHVPGDQSNFQGDFDFTGSKGFILRVSAGIDAATHTATWLLQAIDPDTGEVMRNATKGLLASAVDQNGTNADKLKQGFVSYTIRSAANAASGSVITASARIFLDDAPPVDSETSSNKLDNQAPVTTTTVTALGNNAQGAPTFDVKWRSTDDNSGVKAVTVYVAQDGGDFKIWQRQVPVGQTQAVFTGEVGKHYEFLAVATDNAGNREAATISNAVLPDDGSRQTVLDGLGVNEVLSQTAELPKATPDRSYASNALFEHSTQALPGQVSATQPSDLQTVLAPFSLRGLADGYTTSEGEIGAQAMVELADQSFLVSVGALRNEVFHYSKEGGHTTTPLFTLDMPVLDMAVDGLGQLWVMTGSELLQVDANSGAIVRRMSGPGLDPLTHALAIEQSTGDIYVSSGNGIEVFHSNETDPSKIWTHFSNLRVGDLALGPDGRLWAVRWSGSDITAAQANGTTDIVSFPMTGRIVGRAELEYRLNGVVDSIAFGAKGTELEGLLLASSTLKQHPVVAGSTTVPHQSAVWMIELQSRRALQVARGGTMGESILTTTDGRILVGQTGHIDEIAPIHAPKVTAVSVPDGALLPLPAGQIAVVFDQAMWLGDGTDSGSVLNTSNFTFTALGNNTGLVIAPNSIRWDAVHRTAYLDVSGLVAGQYQLEVNSNLRSSYQQLLDQTYISTFTAVLDMSTQVQIDFTNTRSNHATGEVSYDVSLTNIGTDDLKGPLMLLLDPGLYFGDSIANSLAGSGDQSDLWILDLTAALQAPALGGKLAAGATLSNQTITVIPASRFTTQAGMASLAKFNLGHGVYAVPQENIPPVLTVADSSDLDADTLASAVAGQPWTGQIEAIDTDGTRFFWELVQAPKGVTLSPSTDIVSADDGYHAFATLNWTPTVRDLANTEIVVRVQDSRGGVATKRFQVAVDGANHAPMVDSLYDITLTEGESLALPIGVADADGDPLTVTVRNLPAGAVFDSSTGMLTWVPSYDQAGIYNNISIVVSDGKATASQHFNVTVEQGYAKPTLAPVAAQTLREGEHYALQLAGNMPGGLLQADGTAITLEYIAPSLPGGVTLNSETGWLEWTPDFAQHGTYSISVTLLATFTPPDGEPVTTETTQTVVFNVLNTNGAPQFDAVQTWNVLEGQPLQISVFAFDPDNPEFAPKIRLSPNGPLSGDESTAPTVSYQVSGLPQGAIFDPDTLEIIWTPGYTQAGTYSVTVTATDEGDGTGTPAVSQIVLPIVVADANRAPDIGDISNAFVDKGATLDIPITAVDADGNPLQLTVYGLPRFATYTQNPSAGNGSASGVIHFAPHEGDRGDYTITVVAQDNGGGNVNQVLTQAKSFVVTARSETEAPVITAPIQVVAVVGQALNVPISVRDLDQDALSYSVSGLPAGAVLTEQVQYGQAVLSWTPTASDLGAYDIEITVTDSGLGPQDAGYQQGTGTPLPNVSSHHLLVLVRNTNAAPQVLSVKVNDSVVADSGNATTALALIATEGTPLSIELTDKDSDFDLLNWTASNLPRGMTLDIPTGSNGTRAVLNWTPDLFAAQDGNTDTPGLWRFNVNASDGMASAARTFEIQVANFNQTPHILPMPLQLVSEGETLGFTLRAGDADNDALRTSLIYDDNTPAGVLFDGNTGYFEWTPTQEVVNNLTDLDKAFTFNFSVTDGMAISTQSVQVRVFDVNRVPRVYASNHAVVVGQMLSLPVRFGGNTDATGLVVSDADGNAQTQALAISFKGLPEGAEYDAQNHRLSWTPGPGQIGDFVITAQVSDGKNTTTQTFTVRSVADAATNAPTILVSTTPSTPALPGQNIVATVRADAYSAIASVVVDVRGVALNGEANSEQWQTVALDGAGRMRLVPTQPGLIEVRVTATDLDGFSHTQTQTIRVKDPADTQAPSIAWTGILAESTALSKPVNITDLATLTASLQEQQLMSYKLEIAPTNASGAPEWVTLTEQTAKASNSNLQLELAQLDPVLFANGVYQLRFIATDLVGRTTTIDARVIIDTANKNLDTNTAVDVVGMLGGVPFSLARTFSSTGGDFGNWELPAFDTKLSTDQAANAASGAIAPWGEGARVWLQVPDSIGTIGASQQYLSFTLGTTSLALSTTAGSPVVLSPSFTTSQGWSLTAHSEASEGTDLSDRLGNNLNTPELLIRQGHHLYRQTTGLPWVPTSFTLTGPDGTRYELDATGKVMGIAFGTGQQWIVSDAGVVAVNGDTTQRVDFIRDEQGRIARITGPSELPSGDAKTVVYLYDQQGRLALVRELNSTSTGTPYGYGADGKPLMDTLTANLGAAVNWTANSPTSQWSGTLQAGQSTALAFSVRESELASTVKVAGSQGAVIVAVEAQLSDPQSSFQFTGATVLGVYNSGGKQTTLLRVTQAGLKLIRIQGTGTATVRVSIAGDLNHDGLVDGNDSQAWAQAFATSNAAADLNGDGLVNQADRQILFANYGWKTNQAPVAGVLPNTLTHTDLATTVALSTVAQDYEGDKVFWRVLTATHGTAKLSADGLSLLFTPEAGYVGDASILVQADDGFAASAPIALTVKVSGAKLLAIHLAPLPALRPGASAIIKATADFDDAKGVNVSASGAYLTVSSADLSGMGAVGPSALTVDDSRDLIRANGTGPALVIVTRLDTDGRVVRAVAVINSNVDAQNGQSALIVQPDVYPATLALAPGGTRQLKVHVLDPNTGLQSDIHIAHQAAFAGTPESSFDYLDPSTQDPLFDPVTGEALFDPDTGEVLLDPNTGVTTHYVVPAVAPVYSGTRYLVSDESIATVSEDGLITALRNGQVTISVIHLASVIDESGLISQQVVGQSDITLMVQAVQLVDNDDSTPAPRSISVSKETGGVVSGSTGEVVMIGAGALSQDTAVSIDRINVADIESDTGMAIPGLGALGAVGAFRLDIGENASNYPLQLAIPVQAGIAAELGEEVLFFRKGQVLTADGSYQDTWWLVDNGFVVTDGNGQLTARTASPPYNGAGSSGEYLVCRALPGVISGSLGLSIGAGDWASFAGMSLSGGLLGIGIQSEILGIMATLSNNISAGSYHFGVPQFADIAPPRIPAGETFNLDVTEALPAFSSPYGEVVLPNITGAAMTAEGQVKFSISNSATGKFTGTVVLRALFDDGTFKDIQTLSGSISGDYLLDPALAKSGDSATPFAIGTARWQLVRQIPTNVYEGSGNLGSSEPIEFAGNSVRIAPVTDMAAYLNRTSVTFVRQDLDPSHDNLLSLLGQPNNLNGTYQIGNKTQPVVFTHDLTRVYVGGYGVVYEFDMLTFKLINTITVDANKNISSLATVGNLLIIGEGQIYGATTNRILVMDITAGSKNQNQVVSLKVPEIDKSNFGVSGMSIGPDGRTLVVAVPKIRNPVGLVFKDPGDVLVFDLNTLDLVRGKIGTPVTATLPGNMGGKAPQTITTTDNPNHFLVANIGDYNKGLAPLVITRDSNGTPISAKMTQIDLSQKGTIRRDRIDIQRAQSAVLVERDGVEYAIVADDNYNFNDPYWRAMFEAPDFLFTPFGPPIAYGGSVSATKVNVGGKLGIVKDPFGTPEFIGSTLPLDGYGIINLGLSEDKAVLIGQLKGGYGTVDQFRQKENQNHVWNVIELLDAALAMPEQDRMSKHIKLPEGNITEQLIDWQDGKYVAAPAGTFFDDEPINVASAGNIGDIVGVNLKELAARQLIAQENKVQQKPNPSDLFKTWDETSEATRKLIEQRMSHLTNFSLDAQFLKKQADRSKDSKLQMELVVQRDKNGVIQKDKQGNPIVLSRKSADSTQEASIQDANFQDTGILFFAPILDSKDENSLRAGNTVEKDKTSGHFDFHFDDDFYLTPPAKPGPTLKLGNAEVTAGDFAPASNKFVGDRPVSNPGYTAFKLKGGVGTGENNDTLDVYRVEQRLQYLGYPASSNAKGVKEFVVNGAFKTEETAALKLFEETVRYTTVTETGQGSSDGVTVQVQYRATVTHRKDKVLLLEEVAGSMKATVLPAGASSAAIAEAKKLAVEDAKAKALKTAGFDSEKDTNGMDGKIEGDASNKQRKTTLDWLNAFNAPHLIQFFSSSNKKLTGWVDKRTGANINSLGTSWVFDLMVAAQDASKSQQRKTPLWFAGSGDLGSVLNLGINTTYIGTANQKSMYDDEFLINLSSPTSVDLAPVVASKASGATPQQKLKYLLQEKSRLGVGGWDLQKANQLADLLKYVNRVEGADQKVNNQTEALKDFLTLFSATQKDGSGFYDGLMSDIKSGTNQTGAKTKDIRDYLFGDGTLAGGLVNSKNILLGGTGPNNSAGLGAQLSPGSLGTLLGVKDDKIAQWVSPLNQVMASADINTAKRVSMFLANASQETGQLKFIAENYNNPEIAYFENKYGYQTAKGAELGNTEAGDGAKYRGRGLLHITGKNIYEIATFGYLKSKPSNQYISFNDWQGTTRHQTALSVKNQNGTVTVSGTIPAGWSVRVVFPAENNIKAESLDYIDTAHSGTYSVTSSKVRSAGQVQLLLVQSNFVDNAVQLSDLQNKVLAAQIGAWYWRFERVSFTNKTWDLNPRADTGVFSSTWQKINSREHGDNATQRASKYTTAKNAITSTNAYGNMNEMLSAVGITAQNAKDYNTQFGVSLNKRLPVLYTKQNLLAELPATEIKAAQTDFVNEIQTIFSVDPQEELNMLLVALQDTNSIPVYEAAQIVQPGNATIEEMKHGICKFVIASDKNDSENELTPFVYMKNSLSKDFLHRLDDTNSPSYQQDWEWYGVWTDSLSVTVVRQPKHGEIKADSLGQYELYVPKSGYVGKDRVDLLVEGKNDKGQTVSMTQVYYLNVLTHKQLDAISGTKNFQNALKKHCNSTKDNWSLGGDSSPPSLGNSYANILDLSLVSFNFKSLSNGALGVTSNLGSSVGQAVITLDTTAAGHGWFIDSTPYDNSEYLPTADPTIWQAKAGSAAAGKMDMLSVLLHEYGHVLGIEHSTDSHDFMATTLQPGERRLPSADEMALMSQLVAQLKPADPQSLASTAPTMPDRPFDPSLPLGGGFSVLALGLMRRKDYGWVLEPQAQPQYDIAANPTLTNGNLTAAQGWATQGGVSIGSGAAILSEVSASQTRLNQVFMVGPDDRYLSFTLGGIALDDQATGPDDAFEVALLDANTGASLTGAIGLSKTDALLNLQANGAELAAQGVTHVINPDGSRTYLVDLNGIAGAGARAVNLSFDLIGFGANGSHATVSNVRLIGNTVNPVTVNDTVTTAEDTVAQIIALANDSDVTQAGFAPVLVTAAQHGQVVVNADGTFSYTPNPDYFGTDSFTYKVSSASVDSNVATVNITVTPVNDAPVTQNAWVSTAEDSLSTIDLIALGSDVDSSTLTAGIVTGPQHGTLNMNVDGSYTYLPQANFNGTDSFTYQVNDGVLNSIVATVNLTITAVNDAPTLSDFSVNAQEDTLAVLNLLSPATDVEGDSLTVSIVSNPGHGTLTVNPDGSYTYLAAANYAGADSFSYLVSDGQANSRIATVSLNIAAVNDGPVAQAAQITSAEDTLSTINLIALGSDVDSSTLTAGIVTGPQHGTLTANADGRYTYTPNANFNGSDSFTYLLNDGVQDSNVAAVTITVTPVNDAPILPDFSVQAQEDTAATLALLSQASDVDGDALTAAIVTNPTHGTLTVNVNGTYTYLAAANYVGFDSFSYLVSDGLLQSRIATVNLSIAAVNDAPVAVDDTATVLEDNSIRLSLLSNDSDVEGDALSVILKSQPVHGGLMQNTDGTYTYTPAANWSGEDTFTYVLSDGQAQSNLATVRIVVTPVADAPSLLITNVAGSTNTLFSTSWETVVNKNSNSTLLQQSELEGWSLITTPGKSSGGSNGFEIWSTNDKMADVNNKSRTVTAAPNDGQNWFELNNSGGSNKQTVGIERTVNTVAGANYVFSFDYAGRLGYSADYTRIAVYVDDVKLGTIGDASPTTALNWQSQQYTFTGTGKAQTIRIVSEATKVEASGRGAMLDNLVLTQTLAANTGLEDTLIRLSMISAALKDNDGSEVLSVAIDALPLGATLSDGVNTFVATAGNTKATLTGWNMTRLSLLPPANFNGQINLTVVATATENANGNSASTTASLLVIVFAVNDAPVANNDSVTVRENQSVQINVLANDTDADGDSLSVQLLSGPKHGTVTRNADGTFSYTARCGYTGTDTFTYMVNDGQLGSNTATVSINVVENHIPVANNDNVSTAEDTPVKIDLLANDTDADGDTLTARILCNPCHGTLTYNADGTWTYLADKNWYGTDSFTYRVSDGFDDSKQATVRITVTPVNDAPVAKNASYQLQKDGTVRIDFSNLISDVERDVLTLSFASPAHGSLVRNRDGSYTYTPTKGYTGADTFTYTVSDGKLSATGIIALTITKGRDDDHDERDSDNRGSSCIVVSSKNDCEPPHNNAYRHNLRHPDESSNSLFNIDWNGSAVQSDQLIQSNWLSGFFGAEQEDKRSLAELTGLCVKK